MRRAPVQRSTALIEPAADEEEKLARRQAAATARMSIHDSLPPTVRAVANGLPLPDLILPALQSGCQTQEDAEEWLRRVVGQSVLG